MGKGCKFCPSCNSANGPRSFVCKSCAKPFTMKIKAKKTPLPVKPVPTAIAVLPKKRHRRTKEQMLLAEGKKPIIQKEFNWTELKKGDEIRVLGGGPYWPREPEDGGNISIGYSGIFTVKYVDEQGIHATGKQEDNGHCYIFCGKEHKSKTGTVMSPHRIAKINRRVKE